MANTNDVRRRKVGFAYDLTGDNRTVLKAFYGLSRWNSADTLADQENPVGLAQLRYAFVSCAAGQTTAATSTAIAWSTARRARRVPVDAGRRRIRPRRSRSGPADQPRGLGEPRARDRSGLSGRASYVYKNMRNVWGEIDVVARQRLHRAVLVRRSGRRPRRRHRATIRRFNTIGPGRGVGTDRVFTNTDDDADFQNVEFAVNRRFSDKWMMLTSFGYTWSTMYHVNTAGNAARPGIATTTLSAGRSAVRRQRHRNVDAVELQGDRPLRAALRDRLSGSWKVQSGFNYGRTMSVNLPVEGARTVRVEPITANRYPTVPILDVRADKSFRLGRFGTATLQLDVFNLTNAGTVTRSA